MSLYSPLKINSIVIPNRFMRSAVWEGRSELFDLAPPELQEYYHDLGAGEIGLINSSHTYVSEDGIATPRQLALFDDSFIDAHKSLVSAVRYGGKHMKIRPKFFCQLAHCGSFGEDRCVAPSDWTVDFPGVKGLPKNLHALSIPEIQQIQDDFAAAAQRAKEAGYDGVQLHGAHGYLISEFMSPKFNKRTDIYGGSTVWERSRFIRELINKVRYSVGPYYPISIKINSSDFVEGGFDETMTAEYVKILETFGIDAVELSGGTPISGKHVPIRRGKSTCWYENIAKDVYKHTGLPLFMVGGIRNPRDAERLVKEGIVDGVSMGRPFVRETDIVKRWIHAHEEGERAPVSKCISCGLCLGTSHEKSLYCVPESKLQGK
ncbi:NADH:flavin oxidoreductase [Aduncisulcus paluster]|uniref:NADH:flavin oxidoreductase n=1 Tax=Aduncisulcus paluster TaxID=2918883 RepID=A0ABQ5JV63_9EUKA|nr:NADH:flavin oxidoreductase [Aduncisulcus paluster]